MATWRAYNIGTIEYGKALLLQDSMVDARIRGEIPDTVLFLQHPPVITVGRSGSEKNILLSIDTLSAEGIAIIHTDRGGDVTVHSPGQLVVYSIFDLKPTGMGLHQYVRSLEEVVIQTLKVFSITGQRDSRYPGVWVEREKICALGVRASKWVTRHGFALNVNNDLRYFSYIYPCGIKDRQVTSMSRLLGNPVSIEEITGAVAEQLGRIFNTELDVRPAEELFTHAR